MYVIFKCAYCGPPFSSKWTEEVKAKGPYDIKTWQYNVINPDEQPIPEREENPYIEAFLEMVSRSSKTYDYF